MPAAPSATSVRPLRQGRPIVSETITATSRPWRSRSAGAQRAGRRVRVHRQQHQVGLVDVRRVDAGRGHHEAVVGLHDRGRTAPGHRPDGLGGQDLAPGRPRVPGRRPAPRPAGPRPWTRSCWSPRGRRRRAATAPRRRSARPGRRPAVTSPMPRTGRISQAVGHEVTPARSSAAATIAAVAASSVIHSGTARTRTPGTRRVGVRRVDQPAVQQAAVRRGRRTAAPTPAALTSTPTVARQRSAMPRTGAPPMIGDTPTTGAGPFATASRRPGTASTGAMLTTGLLGATSTTSAAGDRLQHTRRRVWRSPRRRTRTGASARRPGAVPTTPGSGCARRPAVDVDHDVGLQPVVGGGQQSTPGCQRSHSASVTAESG